MQSCKKPGRSLHEERAVMERHTLMGHKLLEDSDSAVLVLGAVIALTASREVGRDGLPRGPR